MYIHTDEILFDPLPQPYRYINKLLLRCIEDAIDLAEGGGSAASLTAVVGHNLKLTKVGKIPTEQAGSFFLSTAIAAQEITVYHLLGDTHYLVIGTTQGNITVFDTLSQAVVYSLAITTLSKFAAAHPIQHLNCLETNHSNYVVTFVSDELSYLLFLSSAFVLKTAIELDLSLFSLDSVTVTSCEEPYLVITDGTGRTAIYNCHTPAELVPAEGQTGPVSTKAQANKPIQLEPILELDKCPISTGPVTSHSQLAQRTDDPSARKRPAKKKAAPPAKSKSRAKSPGTVALETASTAETTKYHAVAHVFGQVAVLRFGTFPMLIVYSLQSPNPILNEFALPAPVTSDAEISKSGQLVVGLENGSFCFLNVARRAIHDHVFPRQGTIISMLFQDDILYTFTAMKALTAYRIENYRVVDRLYSCSDGDILECHISNGVILTLNQKSSDLNVVQALSKQTNWDGRDITSFPNISVLNAATCQYLGTAATPVSLKLLQSQWNRNYALFVYDDPVECKIAPVERAPSPPTGKRTASPKGGGKSAPAAAKKGKGARSSKKAEEVKEPEPEVAVVMKRQVISLVSLVAFVDSFRKTHETVENVRARRRNQTARTTEQPSHVDTPPE